MPGRTTDPALKEVEAKVERRERLSDEDALACFSTRDVLGLGRLANLVRERIHGPRTFYRNDMNLNHTNACVLDCDLCAFYRPLKHDEAYLWSPDEIEDKARRAVADGVNEFHIVGGLHPKLKADYFCEVFERIKAVDGDAFIQALTAVELDYVAKVSGTTVEELLDRLVDAGLGSVPGGGAEIFHPDVRPEICDHKTDADRWLDIHRTVHAKGLASNATMLYGHVEEDVHRVHHMRLVRELQDETGGFEAFIPLAFNPDGTALARRHAIPYATGATDLRVAATARLFLDNVPHVKLVWQTVGKRLAQVSQSFGVDDIGGTAYDERILWAAGAQHGKALPEDELVRLIRAADREPVFTNSAYEDLTGQGHPLAGPVEVQGLNGHGPRPRPPARAPAQVPASASRASHASADAPGPGGAR